MKKRKPRQWTLTVDITSTTWFLISGLFSSFYSLQSFKCKGKTLIFCHFLHNASESFCLHRQMSKQKRLHSWAAAGFSTNDEVKNQIRSRGSWHHRSLWLGFTVWAKDESDGCNVTGFVAPLQLVTAMMLQTLLTKDTRSMIFIEKQQWSMF